ncbi:conserved hypothetical protein [Aspergillus lentulus]|nr:conserved hypothetical protein [Aspergillus lentulus]
MIRKKGYQGAFYFEVGLDGLGLMMSLALLVKNHLRKKAKKAAAYAKGKWKEALMVRVGACQTVNELDL